MRWSIAPNANGGRHRCRPPLSAVGAVPVKARSVPGSGSGRGLAASVGSLSGSSPKPKLLQGSQGDPSKRTSMEPFPGPRRSELRRFPESRTPSRSSLSASFRFPSKQAPPGSDRVPDEANFDGFPFAVPSPEGSGSAGQLEESGVGIGLRLCLALLPPAPRPSSFHDVPEGPPLPLSGRCRVIRFSVSGGTDSPAAGGQWRGESIRARATGLWITGITGIVLI